MVLECTYNGPPALLRQQGHVFNHSIKCSNMTTIALPGLSAGQSIFALWSKIPHAQMKMTRPLSAVGIGLATDESLAADPGVAISIPARSHTFVEINHEIISRSFSSLPLNHSRRVVVSYK